MSPDRMSVHLHLRRIRVVGVLVDLIERLVVEIVDVRRVVRCPHCGFKTTRVHDDRRLQVHDPPTRGRPTTLEWVRRRFVCAECSERHWEDHPEIILGRRTHVTRRLARQLVRDVNVMSIREVARRHGLPWHFIMGLTRSWSDRVAADRRRRRCRVSWFAAGMIEVRRRIQRIGEHGSRPAFEPEIFRSRYLQLTRFDQLEDDRIEALGRVLSNRPELEAAWRMLQHLYGIHLATDTKEANQALGAFIDVYQDHPLVEFEKLTETLLEWGDEIFAFHDTGRITNGRIEGTNNKIGVLKRIAYGFVSSTNFAARALLLTPGLATSP